MAQGAGTGDATGAGSRVAAGCFVCAYRARGCGCSVGSAAVPIKYRFARESATDGGPHDLVGAIMVGDIALASIYLAPYVDAACS